MSRKRSRAGLGRTLFFALLLAGACSKTGDDAESKGWSLEACRAACAAFVTAGCDRIGLRAADQSRCVASCQNETRVQAPAGCDAERRDYLACVGRAEVRCEAADCSAAHCLENARGVPPCAGPWKKYRQCVKPCLFAGSAHTGERRDEAGRHAGYHVERLGCGPCPPGGERGAPVGSPCGAASVCSSVCCECERGPGRYLARVCLESKCAGRDAACLATVGVAHVCN